MANQSIVNLNSFLILSFAGVNFTVGGALNSMGSTNLELVSTVYTLVTLENNTKVIFKINQAFLDGDPDQTEALFQPHQMRSFGIGVDDCTKRHMIPSDKIGGQCIKINDQEFGMNVNLDYFRAQNPTTKNLTKYPIVEIASPLPY